MHKLTSVDVIKHGDEQWEIKLWLDDRFFYNVWFYKGMTFKAVYLQINALNKKLFEDYVGE